MGATFVFQLLILAILHTAREHSVLPPSEVLIPKCLPENKKYKKVIKKENNH